LKLILKVKPTIAGQKCMHWAGNIKRLEDKKRKQERGKAYLYEI